MLTVHSTLKNIALSADTVCFNFQNNFMQTTWTEHISNTYQTRKLRQNVLQYFGFIGEILSWSPLLVSFTALNHSLRTPREEIAFTAQLKIHSHSQIFRYGRSIFCLPHQPKFSDIFDLCLHWVSVVRVFGHCNFSWHAQLKKVQMVEITPREIQIKLEPP